MNRICIGYFCRAQDPGNIAVALVSRRRTNAHIFVCKTNVQRIGIGLRMYGNRLDAQFFAGPNNPQGDFPSVGHKDFFKWKF